MLLLDIFENKYGDIEAKLYRENEAPKGTPLLEVSEDNINEFLCDISEHLYYHDLDFMVISNLADFIKTF